MDVTGGEHVGQASSMPQSINMLPVPMQKRVLEASVRQLHRQLSDVLVRNSTDYWRPLQDLVAVNCSDFTLKYQTLNVEKLFLQNCQTRDNIERLVTALGLLHKYANNLLKKEYERPLHWREIYLVNLIFSQKVDIVEGSRDILVRLGYELVAPDKMTFPEGKEPDRGLVAQVTADILLARDDLQAFLQQQHPQQQQFSEYLQHICHKSTITTSSQAQCIVQPKTLPPSATPSQATPPQTKPPQAMPSQATPPSDITFAYGMASQKAVTKHNIVTTNLSSPNAQLDATLCDMCEVRAAEWTCALCDHKVLCRDCDHKWHCVPMRTGHTRQPMSLAAGVTNMGFSGSSPRWIVDDLKKRLQPGTMLPMSEPHTMLHMAEPRTMPTSAISAMSGPRTMPLGTMPPTSRHGAMPPPILEPHTMPYMAGSPTMPPNAISPMSGPRTMPAGIMSPMSSPSTPYMLQYNTLPDRNAANEQKKYLLMIKVQYHYVVNKLRQTVTSVQQLNLRLYSLIRSNPDFMVSSNLESLKKDITIAETQKGELEKEKAELEIKLKKLSSNVACGSAVDQRLSASSGSPSPLSQGSQSPSLLAHPPDTFIPVSPLVHGSQSPSLLEYPRDISKPLTPQVHGSKSPSLLEYPRDISKPLTPQVHGSQSPSLLEYPRDISKPLTPPVHSSKSPSLLQRPPDIYIPVSPPIQGSQNPTLSTHAPDTPTGTKTGVNLSDGLKEQQDLQSGNGSKIEENVEVSHPPSNPRLKSHTLTRLLIEGTVTYSAVPSSSTPTAAAVGVGTISNSATRGTATGGGAATGGAANGGAATVGAATGGAATVSVVTGGAATGGVATGGAAVHGAAVGDTVHSEALKNATCETSTSNSASTYSTKDTSAAQGGAPLTSASASPGTNTQATRTRRGLKSWLADIHKQKEEEQRKIEALKKKRVSSAIPNHESHGDSIADQVKFIKRYLHDISDDLSEEEVKAILETHEGKVDLAVQQCRDARIAKLTLLQAAGVFSETEALAALRQCKGCLEEAQKRIVENIVEYSDWDEAEYQAMLRDKDLNRERKIRLLLTCGHLQRVEQADTFLQILERDDLEGDIKLSDILESVKNCNTLSRSISYLQQECQLCLHHFSASKIHSQFLCQCKFCFECLKQYLELYVREKLIKEFVCPVCGEPDTDNIDLAETHFEYLDMIIRQLLSSELYSLFERKLTEWHLMRDPNFRWCSQPGCVSGFIGDPTELRMECPTCERATCFQCKKPWADQHEGITCEEFQAWKEANDPEHQQAGLARHLEDNGIDCPHCNFRYSLAKGGCMHFKCIQCGHEFCSGCCKPFKRGSNCNVLPTCQGAGLHCHHPRDCLFYLRDRDVTELQTLLNDHSVDFDTAPPSGSDCSLTCQVMEQREMPNGVQDAPCQRPVPANYAGLCEMHYKEYLVSLINKNSIDPVVIMSNQDLKRLLTNAGKSAPQKSRKESGEHYHKKLIQQVKQLLPLPTRRGALPSSLS